MQKKISVFCVDLGYSLKKNLQDWKKNHKSYPGHILYGVNHMEENGLNLVFEFGQHGMVYGKWYKYADELLKLISLFVKCKQIDAIWIPHAGYSKWIPILRKLRLIRVPVIGCLHNKNNLRCFIYGLDKVITINPRLYDRLCQKYPDKKKDISYIPLAPELVEMTDSTVEKSVDVVSIGNTKRDFRVLIKAMQNLPYSCRIISTKINYQGNIPKNVEIIDHEISYEECLRQYAAAKVIVISLSDDVGEGVFGLTSLVDAFTVSKPLVITKTKGIGIPVAEWKCGIEVNNQAEMTEAIKRLLEDTAYREEIRKNIEDRKKSFNMPDSSSRISQVIKDAVGYIG